MPGRSGSWWSAGACLVLAAQVAGAQVVRGTVTERTSGRPLGGVLVGVANAASGGPLARGDTVYALTNERGEYTVRLPGAGSVMVAFKRIGVARHAAPPLRIGAGESARLDVQLDALAARLPVTDVSATNLCLDQPSQLRTIAALWDEARTVLRASEITSRDQRVHGWLSTYRRTLDPRTLRILLDQRSVAEGLYDRPMRSVSEDELARFGFWGASASDTLVFNGPDARSLLSSAFHQGYCFRYVQGRGERGGLHGIEFRPRRGGGTGGITGTMWIDLLSFELRFVEFRYANLFTMPSSTHLGGEVHFVRHESGGWVVQRWRIRMPQLAEVRPGRTDDFRFNQAPAMYRMLEEGGSLYARGLRPGDAPGRVTGVVLDSLGREPLPGAVVSLSGTPYSTQVDAAGRFAFDSIFPGAYVLLAANGGYAQLGQLAADHPLNVEAGRPYDARLRAASTDALRERLCDYQRHKPGDAVLRILAIDPEAETAIGSLRLWLRWADSTRARADSNGVDASMRAIQSMSTRSSETPLAGLQSETDATGWATFCGVPGNVQLELVALRSDDDPAVPAAARFVRLTSVVLPAGGLAAREVRVRRPK